MTVVLSHYAVYYCLFLSKKRIFSYAGMVFDCIIYTAVIPAFFILPKTPQGDWNKLKGGKPMSKRNRMRSDRRHTSPARVREQIKRKEARKRAKHRKIIYYRRAPVLRCRCKGA